MTAANTADKCIEDSEGVIVPTWTAVEPSTVKTSREVWEGVRAEGWPVEVRNSRPS